MLPKVLVICVGNRARSQLAEALLRHYGAGKIEVFSAGLSPRILGPEGVHPLVHDVCAAKGISTDGQYSKPLDEVAADGPFDYVITVCAESEETCPIFPALTERLRWPTDDPINFPVETYPQVFARICDELEAKVIEFTAQFTR